MNFFPYHHTGQENKRDKLQQVRREILSYRTQRSLPDTK